MNKLLLILMISLVLLSSTKAAEVWNGLTKGRADTLYCRIGGFCEVDSLSVNNLSVKGGYLNVSVVNYNVTGNMAVEGNITQQCITLADGEQYCTLATTYYGPTSAAAVAGTITGTLSNVTHNDGNYDGLAIDINEVAATPGLDVRMNFTGIPRFNVGIIRYNTTGNKGDEPIIQVWDYEDGDWEDYPPVTFSDTYVIIEQSVFDSDKHIQDGIVQMRLYKASVGNTLNHFNVDWVAIADGISTPSGVEVDPVSIHTDHLNYTYFNYSNNVLQFVYDIPSPDMSNAGGWRNDSTVTYTDLIVNISDDVTIDSNSKYYLTNSSIPDVPKCTFASGITFNVSIKKYWELLTGNLYAQVTLDDDTGCVPFLNNCFGGYDTVTIYTPYGIDGFETNYEGTIYNNIVFNYRFKADTTKNYRFTAYFTDAVQQNCIMEIDYLSGAGAIDFDSGFSITSNPVTQDLFFWDGKRQVAAFYIESDTFLPTFPYGFRTNKISIQQYEDAIYDYADFNLSTTITDAGGGYELITARIDILSAQSNPESFSKFEMTIENVTVADWNTTRLILNKSLAVDEICTWDESECYSIDNLANNTVYNIDSYLKNDTDINVTNLAVQTPDILVFTRNGTLEIIG